MNTAIIEIGDLQYKMLNGNGPAQSATSQGQLNKQMSIIIGLNISTS